MIRAMMCGWTLRYVMEVDVCGEGIGSLVCSYRDNAWSGSVQVVWNSDGLI